MCVKICDHEIAPWWQIASYIINPVHVKSMFQRVSFCVVLFTCCLFPATSHGCPLHHMQCLTNVLLLMQSSKCCQKHHVNIVCTNILAYCSKPELLLLMNFPYYPRWLWVRKSVQAASSLQGCHKQTTSHTHYTYRQQLVDCERKPSTLRGV